MIKKLLLTIGLVVGLCSYLYAQTEIGKCIDYLTAQDYARAIEAGKRAITQNPKSFLAHLCTGRGYFESGLLNSALAEMKVAESLATTMKELQVISNRLGLVYQEMGDFDSALLSHNRSLTLAKNLGDKDGEATDLVNIANILTDKEEYDKALAYYEESLNLQKDELKKGGIYNNIAGVYSKKNDHQTAIKYLNMAADIDERRGDHHALGIRFLNLAAAYVSLGDTENAWPTLERGLKMVKQVGDKFWEARGYEYLSVLSHHTGDSKTARQAAQKAFNLYSTIGAGRRAEEMKTWLTVLDKENIKPDKKKSRTR